ncbi:MAG TPA: hypothetical protein VG960_07050 [Caulobacteraceae bacterium]|nr:hypothetical protein [Caulobacteraceae bacterium]
MTRYATSFVLGYHGCNKALGVEAVERRTELLLSDTDYDWLGPGAYFWESDPVRAMEWAEAKKARGDYEEPFVIGAAIDLGNCLDLMVRENIAMLVPAYAALKAEVVKTCGEMPKNKDLKQAPGEKTLRKLDCAVIRQLHQLIEEQPPEGWPGIGKLEPYDTVRGVVRRGNAGLSRRAIQRPNTRSNRGAQSQLHKRPFLRHCAVSVLPLTSPPPTPPPPEPATAPATAPSRC